MARLGLGTRLPITVEQLGEMWKGHIMVIRTEDNEKYKAKIDGSEDGKLMVVIVGNETHF